MVGAARPKLNRIGAGGVAAPAAREEKRIVDARDRLHAREVSSLAKSELERNGHVVCAGD